MIAIAKINMPNFKTNQGISLIDCKILTAITAIIVMMPNGIGYKAMISPSILSWRVNAQHHLLEPNLLQSKCLLDLLHQNQVWLQKIIMMPPRNSQGYHLQFIHLLFCFLHTIMLVNVSGLDGDNIQSKSTPC